MRVLIPFLMVLFLAAGCAKPDFYWYQADRTFDQAKADYCECREQAAQKAAEVVAEEYFDHLRSPTAPSGSYNSPGGHDKSARRASEAEASWGALYKQNAFNGCMKSRGYVQLKAHRVSPNLRTENLPMGAIAGQ